MRTLYVLLYKYIITKFLKNMEIILTNKINTTDPRIGENLIKNGYMTTNSVDVVLLRQEYGDNRLFGQIATSLNLLTEDHLTICLKS